jgi:hypothetical protein
MQFIEWLLGISPDGESGLLESCLLCFACAIFGLGVWWKHRTKVRCLGGVNGITHR